MIIHCIVMTSLGATLMTSSELPIHKQPTLKALGMIESGENDYAVGTKGERSRYQMSKDAWYESSNYHYRNAIDIKISSDAAQNYLNRLSNKFYQRKGRRPEAHELYVMWNWGFRKFANKEFDFSRCPKVVRDNATRFSNLVYLYSNPN